MIGSIGLGLIRQLVEARDAMDVSRMEMRYVTRERYAEILHLEYSPRQDEYDRLSQDLISYLLLMPCPEIATTQYLDLWRRNLARSEHERENGKLWEAVEDVAQRAIAVYRSGSFGDAS